MIALETVVVRSADLLSADVDGETVMLDIRTGNYFSLGAIGSDIWSRLAEPVQVGALCALLEREYDGDPETIRRDVVDLLDDLLDRKLIRHA